MPPTDSPTNTAWVPDLPIATTLCLLSSVPSRRIGDKVRFLGCVTAYDVQSASLILGHLYPRGTNVLVSVDATLVLETMHTDLTRVGEWVNVVGYVVDERSRRSRGADARVGARVQALMVWATGPLDVGEYERAVEDGMLEA